MLFINLFYFFVEFFRPMLAQQTQAAKDQLVISIKGIIYTNLIYYFIVIFMFTLFISIYYCRFKLESVDVGSY